MKVRTRFAPSPTGYLHIGGVRTALFSWLFARKHGGEFVLRIEDTDRERSTQESVDAILSGMEWLGLDYDEGPYYQTQRFDRYNEVIQQLLDEGKAYQCYCSRERLETLREQQKIQKLKPRYDGYCRDNAEALNKEVNPVIRFRNPLQGNVVVDDKVYGRVSFNNNELDDLIIARSDGTPTYNLTVVVDDMDMGITHVVRGDDHLNNTPRQINILEALGASLPVYAHLPMIQGQDGKRLSKRHGAVSVLQYRDEGFLPQALLNYLVRLGWSRGDQEVFSRNELIQLFDLENINRSAARLDAEKLLWLNQQYLQTMQIEDLLSPVSSTMERSGLDISDGPNLMALIEVQKGRCKTLVELAEQSRFFYQDFEDYDPKAARKNLNPASRDALDALLIKLAEAINWDAQTLHSVISTVAESLDLTIGKVAQPLSVAVSGGSVSPSIDATLALLGKQRTLSRLKRAIDYIDSLKP